MIPVNCPADGNVVTQNLGNSTWSCVVCGMSGTLTSAPGAQTVIVIPNTDDLNTDSNTDTNEGD